METQVNQKLKLAAAALGGVVVTLAAGGIAFASIDNGLGHFRGIDANNDGQITRAEWVQTANAGFDKLDNNKDGKLIVGEIPQPPHGGPGHRRHGQHGGPAFDDDFGPADDQAPPAAAPAPAAAGNTVE
jgi:hypothetical protein